MSSLKSTESVLLAFSTDKVFATLLDIPHYQDWFPGSLKFEVQHHEPAGPGSRFRMSNPPMSWQVEVKSVEANKRIDMVYTDGPWEGTAVWRLEPTDEQHTLLYYDVDLKIQGVMMQMLVKMIDLEDFNKQQMHKVFQGLDEYLKST